MEFGFFYIKINERIDWKIEAEKKKKQNEKNHSKHKINEEENSINSDGNFQQKMAMKVSFSTFFVWKMM